MVHHVTQTWIILVLRIKDWCEISNNVCKNVTCENLLDSDFFFIKVLTFYYFTWAFSKHEWKVDSSYNKRYFSGWAVLEWTSHIFSSVVKMISTSLETSKDLFILRQRLNLYLFLTFVAMRVSSTEVPRKLNKIPIAFLRSAHLTL